MDRINLKEGKFPIIIKPNLGQPSLINLRDYRDTGGNFAKRIVFDAIIIALPEQKSEEILRNFHLNIYLQPILKSSGLFHERRGERYPLQIVQINRIKEMDFRNQPVLEEDNCILWDIHNNLLEIENLFGKRDKLYQIQFEIKDVKKVSDLIEISDQSFILFDIVHDIPNRIQDKINYHSIAIFDKDWANFKFIHASDFHIARRNDFIDKFLKDKVKNKIEAYKERNKDISKIDTFVLHREFEFKEEFQNERMEELRFARLNFNANLRKLIKYINEKVKEKELDFVLMTGDLIDYIQIARGNYQYKNNFIVFAEILLGLNRGLDQPPYLNDEEYVNEHELLAPVFTIVGNHDYRKGHYSIRVGSIRKIFGFKKDDITGYYDQKFFNYLKSLYSKDKYLRDYFRYINPTLNFRVKIGEHFSFIFIDTGQDSIADMHDLLKGGPSTKGIKEYQVDLLRQYIQLSKEEHIVVVMHTPPVSPSLHTFKKSKFRRKFKLKREIEWSDFYEHNLKNYIGSGRIEKVLNLKYQTIMYNWATFLKICVGSDRIIRRKVDLILCGHTHTLKEFRLKEAREKENINLGFYFAPIIINIPCEVYTNNYRAIFKSFRDPKEMKIWYDVNKPFIFQTQAVGPISLKLKFKPPGFRYFSVKQDQIVEARVFSLHLKETKNKNEH